MYMCVVPTCSILRIYVGMQEYYVYYYMYRNLHVLTCIHTTIPLCTCACAYAPMKGYAMIYLDVFQYLCGCIHRSSEHVATLYRGVY